MKKTIALLVACTFATASAFGAEAISPEKIKEKAQTCAACHGPDGNSTNSMYPRLAGQYHDYLARALQEYKSGERKNPIMGALVTTLSDAEIRALADYYGELPGKLDDLAHHEQGD